jgi:phosphohistidine phosphatase
MILFVLRHAEAEASAGSDFVRALTPKGVAQARNMGFYCREVDCLPDVVLTSPLVRARQTAELFSQSADIETPIIEPGLACGMSTESAIDLLSNHVGSRGIMIVGHEPDLSQFIGDMIGVQGGLGISMHKGTLAVISCVALRVGGGSLEALLPQSLVKGTS